jgi:hypothetical protein
MTILRYASLFAAFIPPPAKAVTLDWFRRFGTTAADGATGVSANGQDNVFVIGTTEGSLGGPHAGGGLDLYWAKYDSVGNRQLIVQFGTSYADEGRGIASDGLDSVYISGRTPGDLYGGVGTFLAKYDTAGSLVWGRQLGYFLSDPTAPLPDGQGSVYIAGTTQADDLWLAQYDALGNQNWIKQFGTSYGDYAVGLSADALGNIYVAGWTLGDFGGPNAGSSDAFLAKFDSAGDLQWVKQLGSSTWDYVKGVSADGLGNIFVAGDTQGSLGGSNAGGADAFLAKYNSAGDFQWVKQLGTSAIDGLTEVAADQLGNAYVSGSFGGNIQGFADPFVAKFDGSGNLVWSRQFGTTRADSVGSLSIDGLGNLYAAGSGLGDALLAKYSDLSAPGDFNNDGAINAADYVSWRKSGGTSTDYNTWRQNFGALSPGATAVASSSLGTNIPEPMSLALIAVLLVSLAIHTRCRR